MAISCIAFNDKTTQVDWQEVEHHSAHTCLWLMIDRENILHSLNEVSAKLGIEINNQHIKDVQNAEHPSFFDATDAYEMIIIRTLEAQSNSNEELPMLNFRGRSFAFFHFEHLVITIFDNNDPIMQKCIQTLVKQKTYSIHSNHDLIYQLLNVMVEQYLQLRNPLAQQYSEWQRLMLSKEGNFAHWQELINYKAMIDSILALCEDIEDTFEDWRRHTRYQRQQQFIINLNDLEEHTQRAIYNVERLTDNFETLIQLHFSAISHRNNEILRILAIISAIFMPLTLITGIFGMNFDHMPVLRDPNAYYATLGVMLVIAFGLLIAFRWRKWI